MNRAAMEALARAQDGVARIAAGEQAWARAVNDELRRHPDLVPEQAEMRIRESRAGLLAGQDMTVGGQIARTQAAVASALLLADAVTVLGAVLARLDYLGARLVEAGVLDGSAT